MKYLIFLFFLTIISIVIWIVPGLGLLATDSQLNPRVPAAVQPLLGNIDESFLKTFEPAYD